MEKTHEPASRRESGSREISFDPPPWRWYPLRFRLLRFLNRALNRWEHRRRLVTLRSNPILLVIDPSNICQLRCPLCPTGTGEANHAKGYLSFALFKEVIDLLGPYIYELHLYNWGEPLLNRDLCDMIEYASRFPVRIRMSAHLNYLPEAVADRLVRSGVADIGVAVDAMTEETYQEYHVGGTLQKVLENMRLLVEKKQKYGLTEYPRIIFRFMVASHNEHEFEAARAFADENGFVFRKKSLRIDMNDFSQGTISEKLQDGQKTQWLPASAEHNRYEKRKRKKHFLDRVCRDLWQRAFVAWDGSIHPCCNTSDVEDFFTTSWPVDFRSVWNGPHFQAARKIFRDEYDPDRDPHVVCKPCTERQHHLFVS